MANRRHSHARNPRRTHAYLINLLTVFFSRQPLDKFPTLPNIRAANSPNIGVNRPTASACGELAWPVTNRAAMPCAIIAFFQQKNPT